MLSDARTRAETLERQSCENVASLERDSIRKRTEIVGAIACEKIALEQKIDELHAFDREYRTQLQTYLNSQSRKLDGRGAGPASKPDVHAAGLRSASFVVLQLRGLCGRC